MTTSAASDVTGLLVAWSEGDRAALDRLIPFVYEELKRLAHRRMQGERPGHPLQTTALVNEAYLRLIDINRVRWQDRAHFFAVAAQAMRRVLVEAARTRDAQKRGGDVRFVTFDEDELQGVEPSLDLLALHEALDALARMDERKARVVELRFFGGLSVDEAADALGVSSDTVVRDWKVARLWLMRELRRTGTTPPEPLP